MNDFARKGVSAELLAAHKLIEEGYRISFPFGHHSPYDLIVEHEKCLLKVQVKGIYSYMEKGKPRYRINLKRRHIFKGMDKQQVSYEPGDYDLLCAIWRETGEMYLIPYWDIKKATLHFNSPGKWRESIYGDFDLALKRASFLKSIYEQKEYPTSDYLKEVKHCLK